MSYNLSKLPTDNCVSHLIYHTCAFVLVFDMANDIYVILDYKYTQVHLQSFYTSQMFGHFF